MLTSDAKYTCEIKSGMDMAQAAFNTKKKLYTSKLYLNVIKKLVKCCIWNIALCDVDTWTLRKVDEKYLESLK
jgi:hypothetical protein